MTEQAPPLDAELLDRILNPPPAWTPCLPEILLRQQVTDFVVEEIPAYDPCGEGEHLYLWLEKTDVAAADLTSRLAAALEISTRDIGVAGQKDRRAVTRQFVSVPSRCESQLSACEIPGVEILRVQRHTNKLRTGHLSGNRFQLTLRLPAAGAFTDQHVQNAAAVLREMESDGFPNYFGPQRFGRLGGNVPDGIAYLRSPSIAKRWSRGKRRFLSRMLPSAVQSAVFNLAVAQRVSAGSYRTPSDGDVVCRRAGTRPFLFADAAEELQPELIPMGPLPGPDMLSATGSVLEREQECLAALGLGDEDFAQFRRHSRGARRRMVETLQEPTIEQQDPTALRVSFVLPAGSFATVVLAQIAANVHTASEQTC